MDFVVAAAVDVASVVVVVGPVSVVAGAALVVAVVVLAAAKTAVDTGTVVAAFQSLPETRRRHDVDPVRFRIAGNHPALERGR